ncbi:Elongation of very long chain fatty acids protein [Aphelenchoides besseyi]|nr:Elongation of very long chain fatty acids protein [Aphelenchoides besseyi]KAI6194531.1 Elongation of very long chain fatty acids protein [Aphelenchoides besseyi]
MTQNATYRVDSGHAVWNSKVGPIPYIPYDYQFVLPYETAYWNSRAVHNFILRYWFWSIPIAFGYVTGIHALQAWMRNRKPFQLNRPLMWWNLTLSIFSFVGTMRTAEELFHVIKEHGIHDCLCYTYDPSGIASLWNFLFIASKLFELVDTLFIVLRKRPLILLHWYHHAAVLLVTWHGAQMIISASRVYTFMNFFVHGPMFLYFTITSAGYRPPRKCAMMVTILQNVQMIFGILVALYIAKVRWFDGEFCHVTDQSLALCFFVYFTFGILFGRFFVNAYLKKKAPAKFDNNNEQKKID